VSLSAWRIVKRKLAAQAFTGEGARIYGGRWNSPGIRVVYTSQSRALAALEILVHLESEEVLEHYVMIEVRFDLELVTAVETSELPTDWQAEPAPLSLQSIGDAWVTATTSAVLQVPSAIIPGENNFLLNPAHPDFSKLAFGMPAPFPFDPRLVPRK
jgi:RES domain-containing protein